MSRQPEEPKDHPAGYHAKRRGEPLSRRERAELRSDAVECFGHEAGTRFLKHLRNYFEADLPAWRTPELAAVRPGNCDTIAKIRDGQREVVTYLEKATT